MIMIAMLTDTIRDQGDKVNANTHWLQCAGSIEFKLPKRTKWVRDAI